MNKGDSLFLLQVRHSSFLSINTSRENKFVRSDEPLLTAWNDDCLKKLSSLVSNVTFDSLNDFYVFPPEGFSFNEEVVPRSASSIISLTPHHFSLLFFSGVHSTLDCKWKTVTCHQLSRSTRFDSKICINCIPWKHRMIIFCSSDHRSWLLLYFANSYHLHSIIICKEVKKKVLLTQPSSQLTYNSVTQFVFMTKYHPIFGSISVSEIDTLIENLVICLLGIFFSVQMYLVS